MGVGRDCVPRCGGNAGRQGAWHGASGEPRRSSARVLRVKRALRYGDVGGFGFCGSCVVSVVVPVVEFVLPFASVVVVVVVLLVVPEVSAGAGIVLLVCVVSVSRTSWLQPAATKANARAAAIGASLVRVFMWLSLVVAISAWCWSIS